MRIAAAAVRVFITDAVAAGVFAFRSKRTSSVLALITTPEKLANRGSAASSATEQVRLEVELGLGDALAELLGCACSLDAGALKPPMLNPPIKRAKMPRPITAPLPTSLKYVKPGLPWDTNSPFRGSN